MRSLSLHLSCSALLACSALAGCGGTTVPYTFEGEPVCTDFSVGTAEPMQGGLKRPLHVAFKNGTEVVARVVLVQHIGYFVVIHVISLMVVQIFLVVPGIMVVTVWIDMVILLFLLVRGIIMVLVRGSCHSSTRADD